MPPAKQLRAVFHLSLFNQPTSQTTSQPAAHSQSCKKRRQSATPGDCPFPMCIHEPRNRNHVFTTKTTPHERRVLQTYTRCKTPKLPDCCPIRDLSHSLPRHRYLALLHHPYCKIVLPTAPTIAQGCMCVVSLRCSLRPTLTCLGAVESRAKC